MSRQNMMSATSNVSRRMFLEGLGVLGLGLALGACSSSGDSSGAGGSSSSSVAASSAEDAANSSSGSMATAAAGATILVAFFSGTGHTRRVAEELASQLDADLFEITPANPYTEEDLNFNEESSRVVQEYENEDQRDTELSQNAPDNFATYERVLVGYPIWWGDSAWAMHRFASENDFTGKTVVPFCTSMSSPLGESGQNSPTSQVLVTGRRASASPKTLTSPMWASGRPASRRSTLR